MLTDAFLQSLGFVSTHLDKQANRANFNHAWRYRFDHDAHDGASLYIEHPLGINSCRLSTMPAPLAATDVFATVPLGDRPALAAAMGSFFAAHGGMGAAIVPFVPFMHRPTQRTR